MKTRIYRTIASPVFVGLLVLLVFQLTMLSAAAAPHSSSPDYAHIDAYVASEMQANHLPGLALGIVHGETIAHLHGFGTADQASRAVTPQTPFILGSTSKSFTALAIMQLVEAGKVDLDAPVQRYLPWFRVADASASARISVHHLLDHTSGIPGTTAVENEMYVKDTGNETLEQFVRSLRTVTLDRPVGTSFEYANPNYSVLGLIVQVVSGQSYDSYIQQHIFAPLQMQNSFASKQAAMRDGLAQGYRWWFGAPLPNDLIYYQTILPAGFLISSAEDMSHYLVMQMNGGHYANASVLSSKGIATMHAPGVTIDALGGGYGMGWEYVSPRENDTGGPLYLHNGETTGNFHSEMLIEAAPQWGIILLTNIGDSKVFKGIQEGIIKGIAEMLIGHAPADAGLRASTVYLIIDGLLGVISILVLVSVARLPRWYKKFAQRRHRLLRLSLRLSWELVLPLTLLIGLTISGSGSKGSWPQLLLALPDLGWWLLITLVVVLTTGIIRGVLAFRVLRRKDADRPLTALSPSPSLTEGVL
jgi:CubicO group peptidase (beta-lactamase class C family)